MGLRSTISEVLVYHGVFSLGRRRGGDPILRGPPRGSRGGAGSSGPQTHLRWSRSCSASCWCCSTSARRCRTVSLSRAFSSRRPHSSLGPCSAMPVGEPAGPGPAPSWGEGSQERCFQTAQGPTRCKGPQMCCGKDGDLCFQPQ